MLPYQVLVLIRYYYYRTSGTFLLLYKAHKGMKHTKNIPYKSRNLFDVDEQNAVALNYSR